MSTRSNPDLSGKVAVVTGATRGAGRAIAVELGAAGATVFVAGRTTRTQQSEVGRSETIEETAELVDAAGGKGIAVRCDLTDPSDVDALAAKIDRLDIFIDNAWGGENLVEWGKFWEHDLDKQLRMWRNGVETHLVAIHKLMPLVVRSEDGLVVEVTDGEDGKPYYVNLTYDAVKSSVRTVRRRPREGSQGRSERDGGVGHAGVPAVRADAGVVRGHRGELAGCDREGA